MEMIYSSETLVNFQWTTQHYIVEDKILLEPKGLLLCWLVPILSQMNPIQILVVCSFPIHVNIIIQSMSRSFKWFFPLGFPAKLFYIFWCSPVSAICLIHLTHHLISIKIFDEEYKMKLSSAFLFLLPLGSKHSPQHSNLYHPLSIYYPLPNMSDQVSTTGILHFCTNLNLYGFSQQIWKYKILNWMETSIYKVLWDLGPFSRANLLATRG
jgi:hypothetical protein